MNKRKINFREMQGHTAFGSRVNEEKQAEMKLLRQPDARSKPPGVLCQGVGLSFGKPQDDTWASQVALVVKNLPANTGDIRDAASIPGSGRYPGGGHGNPLHYSCLENPKNRGVWRAAVHRVTQLDTTEVTQHTLRMVPFRLCHSKSMRQILSPLMPSDKLRFEEVK